MFKSTKSPRPRGAKSRMVRLGTGIAIAALVAARAPVADAANITFGVIAPHEYDLPVDYTPFFAAIQYGEQNYAARAYNAAGNEVAGSRTSLFVGLTKFVYFFKVPAFSKLGFALESITPEVGIVPNGPGNATRGVGDNLWGLLIWFKPTENTTLGIQDYFSGPTGMSNVSNHDWANYGGFFFDGQFKPFNVTGDVGILSQSTQYLPGTAPTNLGQVYFANVRVGLPNSSMFEPFVGADWQTQGAAYRVATGVQSSPSSNETAVDAGVQIKFTPKVNLSVYYSRAVEGRNVDGTNAGYFKLTTIW